MKNYTFLVLLVGLSTVALISNGQEDKSYFDGKFKINHYTTSGHGYKLIDFSREGNKVKAKYFATNAYSQYSSWKGNRKILLVVSGCFSDGMEKNSQPVGLCVDNGKTVNSVPDFKMDGMAIVYNGAAQEGGIAVVDMSQKPVHVEDPYLSGNYVDYYPRTSPSDRVSFLNWGSREGLTLFQTQLVYSKDRPSNFADLDYGTPRERRFLAICTKNGVVHHVVIDARDQVALNRSTKYAKDVLEYAGFYVLYILNLDTGGHDIEYLYNGYSLEDMKMNPGNQYATLENATNLLVYFYE